MRFLVLSDIHGAIDMIDKLDDEFSKVDAVLVAGDFAEFNDTESAEPTLKHLLSKHERFFCVAGNCDEPSFVETLDNYDVCIQGSMVFSEGLSFSGSGGALRFTGTTPFERDDEDLINDLRLVRDLDNTDNLILLIHQPPFNTKLDVISAGAHVGSKLARGFIQEFQPLIVVSGHIHESFAIDTLDKTTLINPGSLAEGRYGIIELVKKAGEWSVEKCELHLL